MVFEVLCGRDIYYSLFDVWNIVEEPKMNKKIFLIFYDCQEIMLILKKKRNGDKKRMNDLFPYGIETWINIFFTVGYNFGFYSIFSYLIQKSNDYFQNLIKKCINMGIGIWGS